ncbi:MAG: hypothetical protein JWP16_666 [Alphaproteobacteria bacterium]|nr:hypothetical protein [Alphaproteobacteria bacterium]
MALTHVNVPGIPFDPAPARPDSFIAPARHAAPYAALAALPRLHAEAGANLALSRFLARSAPACMILMLAGITALSLSGGGSLKAGFAWSALLLLGIIAMTRNYIRGFARSLRRVPLQEAVSDLRILLLYSGTAWGSGAFLIMPDLPAPALVLAFALVPSFAMALCLKTEAFFFTVPVTVAVASATVLGAWPLDSLVAPIILAAGTLIAGLPAVQHASLKKTQATLPSH